LQNPATFRFASRASVTYEIGTFARGGRPMVQMLIANVGVLAIATIYYAWRDGYHVKRQAAARRVLRDRVAYMLWMAANRA
jgi:hypothetical protein